MGNLVSENYTILGGLSFGALINNIGNSPIANA